MEQEQIHNHNHRNYLAVHKVQDYNKLEAACLDNHYSLALEWYSDHKLQEADLDYNHNNNQEVDLVKLSSHKTRRTLLAAQCRVVDLALDKELALGRDSHKASRGEVKTNSIKQEQWVVNKHRIHNRGTITNSLKSNQTITKYLEKLFQHIRALHSNLK